MIRLLLKKYVNESLLLWSACAAMLVLFCWVRVWIVCQFELQRFEVFLDQLKPFEKFSPVPLSQLLTYAGSVAMTFDEPVLILCVLVWSIARGSDVVSGEINRGTLELLLSLPIGRARLMILHGAVCVAGLLGLCSCVWLGLFLGIQTNTVKETITPKVEFSVPYVPLKIPVQVGSSKTVAVPLRDRIDAGLFLPPVFNLFGFGFVVLSFSVMCSAFDRFRWRTIGIVVSTYVVQLLLYLLSKSTAATSFCAALTFFSCYQPDAIVQLQRVEPSSSWAMLSSASVLPLGLGPLGITCVLLGIGSVFYAIAFIAFSRRDLPAPL
ncbi:MAG: ABC transporter permease subunit [Pirellulaceae bacterium]|nr:ABC transporter permease subunit [Pirellulaceae bacterium]